MLFKETKINVYKSLHLFWNAWMQLLKLKSGLWHRYHVVYNTSMSDYPAVPHRSALIISTMIENTYCIYMHMYRTYLTSPRPIIQAWNSTITQKPLFMCICYLTHILFILFVFLLKVLSFNTNLHLSGSGHIFHLRYRICRYTWWITITWAKLKASEKFQSIHN